MIRIATRADLPRLLAIRDAAGAERLSNPTALIDKLAGRLIDEEAVTVWQENDGRIAGFAAFDAGEGAIAALLVAPGEQGRGIGRALLAAMCEALRAAGHEAATIALEPAATAERHYRAAGWIVTGASEDGGSILRKSLR